MNKNRFARRMVVAAGFLFLGAAIRADSRRRAVAQSGANSPRRYMRLHRRKTLAQRTILPDCSIRMSRKAKIDQIHRDMKVAYGSGGQGRKSQPRIRKTRNARGVPADGAQSGFSRCYGAAAEAVLNEGTCPARRRAGREESSPCQSENRKVGDQPSTSYRGRHWCRPFSLADKRVEGANLTQLYQLKGVSGLCHNFRGKSRIPSRRSEKSQSKELVSSL